MTPASPAVPILDVGALFAADETARRPVDEALAAAARESGGFVAAGLPAGQRLDDEQADFLLSFFDLPPAAREAAATRRSNPASNQLWRGYSAFRRGGFIYNEIYDIGPDAPTPAPALRGVQILTEANAWPQAEPQPGWRAAMSEHFRRMHALGLVLFRSLARGLGADEDSAAGRFRGGYSTLRLLNYPPRPAQPAPEEADPVRVHAGAERSLLTVEHEDACCLSLLWQDARGGLQMQSRAGEWQDVPRTPGALSVHFGDSLGPLTNGAVTATPHRVLDYGGGGGRRSLGFFFELDLDATLAPLAGLSGADGAGEADTYAAALLKVLLKRGLYQDLIGPL